MSEAVTLAIFKNCAGKSITAIFSGVMLDQQLRVINSSTVTKYPTLAISFCPNN